MHDVPLRLVKITMTPPWLLAPPAGVPRTASSAFVQLPGADPVERTGVGGAADLLAVIVALAVVTVVVLVIDTVAVLDGVAVGVSWGAHPRRRLIYLRLSTVSSASAPTCHGIRGVRVI